jgi:hypothetical protein
MKFPGGALFIVLFFIIGLTLEGIAFRIYSESHYLIDHGITTRGLVIGMHRMHPREYPVAPSVQFFTPDGKRHVFHSSDGRNPPLYQIGEEINLHYNPENLEEIQLGEDDFYAYVFAGIGAVFLLLTVWEINSSITEIWKSLFFPKNT